MLKFESHGLGDGHGFWPLTGDCGPHLVQKAQGTEAVLLSRLPVTVGGADLAQADSVGRHEAGLRVARSQLPHTSLALCDL